MIDKRITISLPRLNPLIPDSFLFAYRVGMMPFEKRIKMPVDRSLVIFARQNIAKLKIWLT